MTNRNLHSPTKLTEFARDFENEPETFLNKVVTKITNAYNSGYNTVNVSPTIGSIAMESPDSSDIQHRMDEAGPTEPNEAVAGGNSGNAYGLPSNVAPATSDGRHLNVIHRLSNTIASRKNNLTNYKDTELQQFWMPDSKSKECYECTQKFSTFRRKHHCRLCGQIFCSKCCSQVVPGKIIGCSGDLKVCTHCSKIVLTYLISMDANSDLKSDLQELQFDLSSKFYSTDSYTEIQSTIPHRKLSGYQEEKLISKPISSLTDFDKLNDQQYAMQLQFCHEKFLRNFLGDVLGGELATFLIFNKLAVDETESFVILNNMLKVGYLIQIEGLNRISPGSSTVDPTIQFNERNVYRINKNKESAMRSMHDIKFRTITDINAEQLPDIEETDYNINKWVSEDHAEKGDDDSNLSKLAGELHGTYIKHETAILEQLVKDENLDQMWAKILLPICIRITKILKPEMHGTVAWDIRNYVNFKKLPGGTRRECFIIPGLAFSKNVVHKEMATIIENPRILLLECPIIYQRVEGKYISLEVLQMQETEYLRNVVGRILSLQPNVVIVHKSVSGIAQDMLRSFGICLIVDVKMSVLDRLSRCFQCDIVSSIDSNIGKPKLGTCAQFEIKKFPNTTDETKAIIILTSNYNPKGCSVLLRGAPLDELIKVKRVAMLLLFARYNWRFELSFLSEEFASEISEANSSDETEDKETQLPSTNQFANALRRYALSISPNVEFPLPYLETEPGRKCALRSQFPPNLYYSKEWETNNPNTNVDQCRYVAKEITEIPPFLTTKISSPIDSKDYQSLLAQFRACNGIYKKKPKLKTANRNKTDINANRTKDKVVVKDAMDIRNHQRILVLFCSYHSNPHTPSIFCSQPCQLDIAFCGQNDIMLGEFLERYCFRNSYMCSSCTFPMLNHVRRYVHSMGCIQVKLSTNDADDIKDEKILIQSQCTKCDGKSPLVEISRETWCLSFGKYLELRFHNNNYKLHSDFNAPNAQICTHSLHKDHIQMFYHNGIVTSFSYSLIKIWEIRLPFMILALESNGNKKTIDAIAEEIKTFAPRGYDIYCKIYERLAHLSIESECTAIATFKAMVKTEQCAFSEQVEALNSLLANNVVDAFQLTDNMFALKKMLADSIENWIQRLNEYISQKRSSASAKSDTAETQSDVKSSDTTVDDSETELNSKDAKESKTQVSNDKKKMKTLLRDIFPDKSIQNMLLSPIPNVEHYCLPIGQVPIMVCDQDLSSIIAYSLVSSEYKQIIINAEDQNLRRTYDSPNESDDKDKKNKPLHYTDISFRDATTQFTCRIYFPNEFDEIRSSFLAINEKYSDYLVGKFNSKSDLLRSLFARSLSKSVRWDARGGKSGSKFSKTLDDRFILKEMTKSEITIFENFAPQYFSYITNCWKQKNLTLLAKLFGVFKVTMKKKENIQEKYLLVMENLFHNCEISKKFDLKGSDRNRLVDPNAQSGEIVLLDENLIQMSWNDPLYILTHSKIILRATINRDASFLEENNIMDYSLLVGQNSEDKMLVLGIIDYIRTFTLDKKIESIVKQSGLLGGQGKLPTIIQPKMYRQRFSEAMERYFLSVPDRWDALKM